MKNHRVSYLCSHNEILFLIIALLFVLSNTIWSQTTVYSNDFNVAENPLASLNAGTPAMIWTNITTGVGIVKIGNFPTATSNYALQIANNTGGTTSTSGKTYTYGRLTTFSDPFKSTLSSNINYIVWTFNMRIYRGYTSVGFDASNGYGSAVVLCADNSNFLTANGYAVTLMRGTDKNAVRLVKFTGGLSANANLTTIIGPSPESNTSYNDYYSVKVIYTPATNKWQLFSRIDGASIVDPESGTLTQVGTDTFDDTYTSVNMSYFGFLFSHQSATGPYYAVFDNFKVSFNNMKFFQANSSVSSFGNINDMDLFIKSNELTVDQNISVNSVTVAPGAKLTLNDGITLAATNGITIQNTSSATASFIDANSGASPTAITGTVEQDIPATDRNWYVSVPVSGKTAADITLSGAKIVTRNEAYVRWDDVAAGSTLTPGVGYIAVGSASSGTTSWNLSGNLNSGNVTVPLTASGSSFTGFNLVGNPYPSYLNWEQVLNLNSTNAALVQPTIWYRTKVSGSYAFQTYNSASRIAVPTSASGYIPPMQAFWVKANSAGTLTFTNAMRSHGDGSTGFASNNLLKTKSTQNSQQSVLRLQLNNTAANTSDETVLYFNPNAQNGLDAYDSPKMMNNSTTVPDLYTVAGNEKLVINGMNAIPYDTEIPLSFAPGSGTSFQLKATELNNFEKGTQILLKDNGTGSVTDLTANDTYTFDNSVSAAGRFSLIFKAPSVTTGVNTVDNAGNNLLNVLIYCNSDNQITMSCKEFDKIASISVYNTLGQKLAEQQLGQPVTTLHNQFTSGVYMVRVSVSGKSITKKVIVD